MEINGIEMKIIYEAPIVREIRAELINLYELIKEYEAKIEKIELEKIASKQKINELKKELETNNHLRKLEKMKKQMDLILFETKEQEIDSTINETEKEEILQKIKEIENVIYFSIRTNTTWCPSSLELFNDEEYTKKISTKEYIEANKTAIEQGRDCVLECLKPIYIYYINAKEILKNNKEKLAMLEELVDEMASEEIRKDMLKNNVTLPDFVKGMKYFKHENEE